MMKKFLGILISFGSLCGAAWAGHDADKILPQVEESVADQAIDQRPPSALSPTQLLEEGDFDAISREMSKGRKKFELRNEGLFMEVLWAHQRPKKLSKEDWNRIKVLAYMMVAEAGDRTEKALLGAFDKEKDPEILKKLMSYAVGNGSFPFHSPPPFPKKIAEAVFMKALESKDSDLRLHAIEEFEDLKVRDAEDTSRFVEKALSDKNPDVRARSLLLIDKDVVPLEAAVSLFRKGLKDKSEDVRDSASDTLWNSYQARYDEKSGEIRKPAAEEKE